MTLEESKKVSQLVVWSAEFPRDTPLSQLTLNSPPPMNHDESTVSKDVNLGSCPPLGSQFGQLTK